jgi:hypothetical protein
MNIATLCVCSALWVRKNFRFYKFFVLDILFVFLQPYILNSVILASLSVASCVGVLLAQSYSLLYRFCIIYYCQIPYRILMNKITRIIFGFLGHILVFGLAYFFYHTLINNVPCYPAEQSSIIIIDINNPMTLPFVITLLILLSIFVVFLTIMTTVILLILKNNSGNLSKETPEIYRQLTILLIIQVGLITNSYYWYFKMLTSLIFIVVPIYIYSIISILTQQSMNFLPDIGYFFVTIYGMLNGLFTIIFFTPYRKYTFETFIQFLRMYRLILECISSLKAIYYRWRAQANSTVSVA